MLHILSSLVVVIIGTGLCLRHRRKLHIRLMASAFVLDLALVLYIELTRHAVEKVARGVRPLVLFHATVSLAVLACYVTMIVLGRRVMHGQSTSKSMHRNLGMAFVVLRTTNYVTALIL